MEMRERNREHRTHKRTHTRPLEDPSSFLPKLPRQEEKDGLEDASGRPVHSGVPLQRG